MGDRLWRVGISGSYGGFNMGDEAILQGIVSELRASLKNAEITVFSRNSADTARRHKVERSVQIRDLIRDEAREELRRLDLFILGGGGILYDGDAEIYLRDVLLAHDLGLPVFVYAVSAGPLVTRSARRMTEEALNEATVITVRDKQGKRLLEDVGVTKPIIVTADPALLIQPEPLPPDCLAKEGLDTGGNLAAFSIREPGPAAPDIDPAHYRSLLANCADFLVERLDADIIFVPMERRRDMRHAHGVIAEMQQAPRARVLMGEYSPGQLVSLVGHFRFALGMRLHFLIFSALQGIPFVALPYASKVTGFIESLGLSMPPLHSINAGPLIAHIDRSWDNRDSFEAQIEKKLPELCRMAKETNSLAVSLLRGEISDAAAAENV